MVFSTGGANLANNSFVGVGGVNAAENNVTQVAAIGGTVTGFRCFVQTAPGATITFTLRKNNANTTWTCAITSGNNSGTGSNSGGAVTFAAGDLIDIAAPASVSTSNKPASFAISFGP